MADPVEERVKKIIIEQLEVAECEVTPTASFLMDLGADSLEIVALKMALGEEFDVDILDEDADGIDTVQHAIDYIKRVKPETEAIQ